MISRLIYNHHYHRITKNKFHILAEQNIYEPGYEKMSLMSYANNKGADQPEHPRSLINAFFFSVRCFDSIISRFYSWNFKILASFCGCAGRFVSGLVGNSRRHVLSCRGSYTIGIKLKHILKFGYKFSHQLNQASAFLSSEQRIILTLYS